MSGFDEQNKKEEQFIHNEMIHDTGIPAMVRVKEKKKGGKGKVVVVTLAVALASFGAGSLYTSHSWIQEQQALIAENNNVVSNNSSQSSGSNVSQTSAKKDGSALSVAEVANLVSDSVVEISTESVANDRFMRQYVTEGAGSGVIISEDGYIATNNHVIEGASKIVVRLTDGQEYQATLVGTDAQTDVAVIKIEGVTLKAATLADSSQTSVGDTAIAIGNPLGELGGTVTNGIVSALDREIVLDSRTMTLIQTNAAINPGNSGGGLFNDKGELIGLVVAKSAGTDVEGLGFAIPANVVKEVVDSIMSVGYVQGRPVLGISVIGIDSVQTAYQYGVSRMGVYVAGLTAGTKAEASGLQVGDCIMAVEDTEITSTSDLTKLLQNYKVGDKVKVTIVRASKILSVTVELSESKPTETTEQIETPAAESNAQGQSTLESFLNGFN